MAFQGLGVCHGKGWWQPQTTSNFKNLTFKTGQCPYEQLDPATASAVLRTLYEIVGVVLVNDTELQENAGKKALQPLGSQGICNATCKPLMILNQVVHEAESKTFTVEESPSVYT
jgi:hypothetical protein